jgi:hypothetical protein
MTPLKAAVPRTPAGARWNGTSPASWRMRVVLGLDPGPGAAALAAYGRDSADAALGLFVEARALQIAVWTAFMAERHPQLRERARQRLAHWSA